MFLKILNDHSLAIDSLFTIEKEINIAAEKCIHAIIKGKKIIICGNGGSAADSQHFAAELVGRFLKNRKPLPAIALTTDSSILTCIGNDYSFADIFSRQVDAIANSGDCVIGISTSGNSENIFKFILAAHSKECDTIALLGNDGGKIKSICDCSIVVPSAETARIQECHGLIIHYLCAKIENEVFK